MEVMYSSNSISWVTPAFSKAICMTSCSSGGSTISPHLRLEILVVAEETDKQSHELVRLLWVHPFLEIHEALRPPHGLVVYTSACWLHFEGLMRFKNVTSSAWQKSHLGSEHPHDGCPSG